MQLPGFNVECKNGNKARWGYCNNCKTQGCQTNDNDDADAAIGIGLSGSIKDTANSDKIIEMGAGWTEYFASGSCAYSATYHRYKRVWVSIQTLGSKY